MTKIGVMGIGAVGLAIVGGLRLRNYEVVTYDKKYSYLGLPEDLKTCDFIFVCVPTPTREGGSQDLSAVNDVLSQLEKLSYSGIVILKSTILPGTTRTLQGVYKGLRLVCSPEFITESVALKDFLNPDKVLVGCTKESLIFGEKVKIFLEEFYWNLCPVTLVEPEVAEMAKYMINSYYALRVIYANQIYNLCHTIGVDYEEVRKCFELDKRVAPGHFEVFYKGKTSRGYGGKCLPKDTEALIQFARDQRLRLGLLEEMQWINTGLGGGK